MSLILEMQVKELELERQKTAGKLSQYKVKAENTMDALKKDLGIIFYQVLSVHQVGRSHKVVL